MIVRRTGSCSAIGDDLGEPLAGTATHAPTWLLLEQPGGWGHNALSESALDTAVADDIDRWCRARDVRPGLIQRPDRSAPSGRRAYLASTGDGTLRTASVANAEDLLDPSLQWDEDSELLFLVCTNARRDPCCGIHGRAAFDALSTARPERTWQTSHVGGHRFAANMLCLPHGLLYGRVAPHEAPMIADSYERGEVVLERYRGRTCLDGAAQAGEVFLRRDRGLLGVDDVTFVSRTDDDDLADVAFHTAAGRYVVRVRESRASPPRVESCGADELVEPVIYSFAGVRPA